MNVISELGLQNSYEVNALAFSFHGHFYMLTSNLVCTFYMTSNLKTTKYSFTVFFTSENKNLFKHLNSLNLC